MTSLELKETTSHASVLFNSSVLEDYYGGKNYPGAVKIFLDCAQRMVESLSGRTARLRIAIDTKSIPEIKYFSHQLKGSFQVTGSPFLAEVCEEIERRACNQDFSACRKEFELFEKLSSRFQLELENFVAKLSQH